MGRKSNSCPVVMYPEGVTVGRVRSGKDKGGRVRHVAFDSDGNRVGTFDTFALAKEALIEQARN